MLKFSKSALVPNIFFIVSIILVQILPWYLACFLILINLIILWKTHSKTRNIYILSITYVVGYLISEPIRDMITSSFPTEYSEWGIVVSRFSLLLFVLPFYIMSRFQSSDISYISVGSFRNNIYFPFIWKGKKDPVWRFLLIGAGIIIISFSFMIDFKAVNFQSLVMYALCFALINSILEEILWRGYILGRLVGVLGEQLGLVISSLGFGLYHYSLGFPWSVCFLFSLFGMLMGGVTIKSKGLLPVISLHFVMNIMFALSGIIF
ncbi:membrane protease YdiL (CAAX protease family) [Paenibacillus anaericanus]|uniref:CPBP family intramembrane glutamic endopeptidase n=1 Tax=Paenibacillus anaericanus TaxID=170367 RepID=UPI00278289C3|nr:CPBP family intramembrane glutamic endopeptidase [Paenibacillus anaericanus]MDQ0090740.1 membrane protease YdiL (CAAX protease family) [Paenibacillus anaericanus]